MRVRIAPLIALISIIGSFSCGFAPATEGPGEGSSPSPAPSSSSFRGASPSADPGLGLTYTARSLPPAADGGPRVYGHNWYNGDTVVFKDNGGSDLVGFFSGDHGLLAVVSGDSGKTWRTIRPAPDIPIPVCDALCQGPDGKVHIVGSTYIESIYARVSLIRDGGGRVVGFESDIPAADGYRIALPMIDNMDFGRWNISAGSDAAGSPRLFLSAYCGPDYPAATPYGQIKACASSVAAGHAPAVLSDWVRLDDPSAAGATVVYASASSTETSHSTGMHLAQHPLSKDLWIEWGPLDTFHDSVADKDPVQRLRAVPSGDHAWSLGSPSIVATFSTTAASGYGYQCQHYALCATADYVWSAHLQPETGLEIDRIDRYGALARNAIPRPDEFSGECLGSFVAFSVSMDASRAWLGVWRSEDSLADPLACFAACWDGGAWTVFDDASLADSYGVGKSAGWDSGLVIVATETTETVSIATIREE